MIDLSNEELEKVAGGVEETPEHKYQIGDWIERIGQIGKDNM